MEINVSDAKYDYDSGADVKYDYDPSTDAKYDYDFSAFDGKYDDDDDELVLDIKTNENQEPELQDDIDCQAWLAEVNLPEYTETFLLNFSIDGRVIRRQKLNLLKQHDLCKMNITDFEHQKILMEHVRLVQKYPFHSPQRLKELKPIPTFTPFKILQFDYKPVASKYDRKNKGKGKGSTATAPSSISNTNNAAAVVAATTGISSAQVIANEKKKQARRRRSFDQEAWNSISNMRKKAEQNLAKADILRDRLVSNVTPIALKSSSNFLESDTKPRRRRGSGSDKLSERRWSFHGNDTATNLKIESTSTERSRAMMYGNMALEYDIMLSQLHTFQSEILHKFKVSINCEVASIFFANQSTKEFLLCGQDFKWYKIPLNVGVCGYVYNTGESINIHDAYSDWRFNSNMDKKTGFKTRNILCQPIRSHRGGGPIIGIIQLLNKINADAFDNVDEDMLSQFMGQIADVLHIRFSNLTDLASKFSGQAIFVGGKGGENTDKQNYSSETAASRAKEHK